MKKGGLEYRDEEVYEAVQFIGYFREFDRKKYSTLNFHSQENILLKKKWVMMTFVKYCNFFPFIQGMMSKSMNSCHQQAVVEQQLTLI